MVLWMFQQYDVVEDKENYILNHKTWGTISKLWKVIIPLYSALVRSHLTYIVWFGRPLYKEETGRYPEDDEGTRNNEVW